MTVGYDSNEDWGSKNSKFKMVKIATNKHLLNFTHESKWTMHENRHVVTIKPPDTT